MSAALYLNLREAGRTDDLTRSLDYSEVCHMIGKIIEDNSFNLIETIAEALAEELLTRFLMLKKLRLEIKKPWAPIAMRLDSVSVEIERGWHTVYISLGSNVGDRDAHLAFAVEALRGTRGCRVTHVSRFICTKPYGYEQQDDFLNGCLKLETLLTPWEVLELAHDIENRAGRVRREHWGPRTLDIDIIFYDDVIMTEETLMIPHKEMHKREFVLGPLAEIAPDLRHPVLGKTVAEMLAN